ncbi:thylakoid membrane photosystem I accumulation factor [Anabaena subtropica]|uniref:Thylakoid membrane photosystem I accumulation factor n=1 Tax=Anabaena subtropica FACHB-260 TaxID=2692884 RepID=A0ABR8CS81_9NOST|nr:thylakoid membrane photosystem I accumulation factor [Anabaena subtropica]MBD2345254.1 thylakoid membrane photosystem I accumulation factor [Anabaena subtropica FACHB-260]
MSSIKFSFLHRQIADWRRLVSKCLLLVTFLLIVGIQPAFAGVNDDIYDGNMFVVYAGNGSLVPSKFTLAQSLADKRPTVLAFYLDDSRDCKQYAIVISRIQEFYGKVTEIIPISVDTITSKKTYEPTEPGYYYSGGVPQVVVFNQSGEVILNKQGSVPFEEIDDKLREVFDLLPRTETVQLKRRSFNEFSSELAK